MRLWDRRLSAVFLRLWERAQPVSVRLSDALLAGSAVPEPWRPLPCSSGQGVPELGKKYGFVTAPGAVISALGLFSCQR